MEMPAHLGGLEADVSEDGTFTFTDKDYGTETSVSVRERLLAMAAAEKESLLDAPSVFLMPVEIFTHDLTVAKEPLEQHGGASCIPLGGFIELWADSAKWGAAWLLLHELRHQWEYARKHKEGLGAEEADAGLHPLDEDLEGAAAREAENRAAAEKAAKHYTAHPREVEEPAKADPVTDWERAERQREGDVDRPPGGSTQRLNGPARREAPGR